MDRFFRGMTAGMLGGILMNAWSFFSYSMLHFTTMRFVDWTGIVLYGHPPIGFGQTLYALFFHLFWAGFLGVIFAFAVPIITSRGLLFKGIFYSLICSFLIYAVPRLYQMPQFKTTLFKTTLSNNIGAIIWGASLALTLLFIEKVFANRIEKDGSRKYSMNRLTPNPARKRKS